VLGEAVWRHIQEHVPAAAFVLYLCDAEALTVYSTYCNDERVIPPETRPIGDGLTGWVAATGRSVVNSDAGLDLPDQVTAAFGLTSVLAVPAKFDERILAVLTFYSREAGVFTDEHVRIAEAAAEIVVTSCIESIPVVTARAA
jgi:GAF domain-containing protein